MVWTPPSTLVRRVLYLTESLLTHRWVWAIHLAVGALMDIDREDMILDLAEADSSYSSS